MPWEQKVAGLRCALRYLPKLHTHGRPAIDEPVPNRVAEWLAGRGLSPRNQNIEPDRGLTRRTPSIEAITEHPDGHRLFMDAYDQKVWLDWRDPFDAFVNQPDRRLDPLLANWLQGRPLAALVRFQRGGTTATLPCIAPGGFSEIDCDRVLALEVVFACH